MITDLKGSIDLRLLLMTGVTFISDDLVLWSKLVGESMPYRRLAGPYRTYNGEARFRCKFLVETLLV